MARDSSTFSLPPATLIALLVGAFGVFAYNKLPWQDTRPAEVRAPIFWHSPQESQDIEARLWEDPLAAVARARRADKEHDKSDRHRAASLHAALAQSAHGARLLVLGVFVSGAPYAADIEQRRRTRYAVLAGLHRAGFVPANAEHVGYFLAPNESDAVPSSEAATVVVYESLTSEAADSSRKVLLLWLDQDAFRVRPLANFAAIVSLGTGGIANLAVSAALIGPTDSDGLRDMVHELQSCGDPDSCPRGVDAQHRIDIYSSTATAADQWVLGGPNATCDVTQADPEITQALAKTFNDRTHGNIQLYRTIANDCTVSRSVYRELKNRGVTSASQITLVAERDSLYARLMGHYFGDCYAGASLERDPAASPGSSDHPTCFTYLRGLDGLTPPEPSGAAPDSPPAEDADAKSKAPAATTADVASGPAQWDYLRRLAARIAQGIRTKECGAPGDRKTHAPGCTRAIGILGSDVYDKILVLQALRRYFPRTVFFTTDLDAVLLDQQNLKWTRHLVIGSSYGLALRSNLQLDTPPFRGSYQTSTFLATLLAVIQALPAKAPTAPPQADEIAAPRDLVEQWSIHPKIFEIGRSDAFDLSAQNQRSDCVAVLKCPDVSPRPAVAFWSDGSPLIGFQIGCFVLLLLMAGAWIACCHPATEPMAPTTGQIEKRNRLRLRTAVILGGLALAFLITITAGWPQIVSLAIVDANGDIPVPILSGASIWAGVIVEVLAVVCVICLAVRGQRKLTQNAEDIAREFHLERPHILKRAYRDPRCTWIRRLSDLIERQPKVRPMPVLSPIECLIARYLRRGRWLERWLRVGAAVIISTAVLVVIDQAVGTSLIEVSVASPSGGSRHFTVIASILSLALIQFLVFWVADAMLLSRDFICDLARVQPAWPPASLERGRAESGLCASPATLWLNVQLVAARTACVSTLVWYPSLVIAAMAVAALTVEFGPGGFASNPLSLVISTVLLIASALLLRYAAETFRADAITRLQNCRNGVLSSQGLETYQVAQIDHLIERIDGLAEGAFAPYSQQPLVKALLVPAATYGGNLLLQYFGGGGP